MDEIYIEGRIGLIQPAFSNEFWVTVISPRLTTFDPALMRLVVQGQ